MKSIATTLTALSLLAIGSAHGQTPDALYEQGTQQAAEGRLEEAGQAFEQALQADPLDLSSASALEIVNDAASGNIDEATAVHIFKAFVVANQGAWEQSMAEADQAVAAEPEYSKAWSSRGNIHAAQEHYEQAIADYSKAIELNPQDAESYQSRGAMHTLREDYDPAIADYTRAVDLNPKYAMSYFNRGVVYANNKKDYDRALADFDEALKIDPAFEEVLLNRGLIYAYVKQDVASAVEDFDNVLEINPSLVAVHLNKAAAFEQAGRTDEAIESYEAYIEKAPAEEAGVAEQARQRIDQLKGGQGTPE
ncbi:MAG: tetratricopeptide repeat protein [Gammaproteobacteria bacterium]